MIAPMKDSIAGPAEPLEQRIARWFAWASGAMILVGCGGLITLDVLGRMITGGTVVESFEIGGYCFAAACTWSLAYALTSKANIRVDLIQVRLPRRLAILLDIAAMASTLAVALMLAWFCYGTFRESLRLNAKSVSILQVPMALPQGIWLLGVILFAGVAAVLTLRALILLLRGRFDAIDALIGNPKIEEEIEHAGRPKGGGGPA